jgi:hypothetical protein
MSNYVEQLLRVSQAYKNAGHGFHPAEAAKRVFSAIDGFALPFQQLSDVIERQRKGHYAKPEHYATASREVLRVLDAQMGVLEAAIQGAARSDRTKVAQTIVDQRVATKRAQEHQSADKDLVRHLIAQANSDVKEAGGTQPDDGGSHSGKMGPIDLVAFRESLHERIAPKEDKIIFEQMALISGQASPRERSRN